VDEIDSEIQHFHNFRTSVTLTLDWVIQHTVMYHHSTHYLDTNKFHSSQKNYLWTDRQINSKYLHC